MSAMKLRGSILGLWSCTALLCLACGGGAKPAESAEAAADKPAASADKPTEVPKADADKPEAKGDAKPEAAKADSKPAPADDGPKPTRTPTDIITAPDVLFLFSFNDSEAKQVAEEKCDKKAAGDPKKKNECMADERKAFPPDGHRFKKDEHGQWWWLTVRQNGNRLVTMHKIPFELGEETATTITLKPTGKDKGQAPMNVPAKVVIEVPNDYQIALKDPKLGRLVFQAKIGVVTE
jgi:hypothetical protein